MAKILFLADLHGNMPATLALEKEMKKIKPDDVWFLGDAVGKGPENHKTLDWVRANCNHYIAGNWDCGIARSYRSREYEKDRFYWNQLNEEQIEWLEKLPLEAEIDISGINFRLLHGRPVDKNFHPYLQLEELCTGFVDSKGGMHNGFISADCHMPYVRCVGKGYAINTGSVGNSLGVPKCHAVLIEGELGSKEPGLITMNILSIPYNNQEAADIAKANQGLNNWQGYVKEVLTGVYSR